jgi:hypothetical protein
MARHNISKRMTWNSLFLCLGVLTGPRVLGTDSALLAISNVALEGIYGPQGALVYKLRDYSLQRQYSAIYGLLAVDYTETVTQQYFLGVCKRAGWRMSDVKLGTLESYRVVAYLPIRCIITRLDGTRYYINTVLFFRNSAMGWRLMNFPFLLPDLPSFATVPSWFVNG